MNLYIKKEKRTGSCLHFKAWNWTSKYMEFFCVLFSFNLYWSIVALPCCVSSLPHSKVTPSHVYIYPFFFSFPSRLAHCVLCPLLYRRFSSVVYFTHSRAVLKDLFPPLLPSPPPLCLYLQFPVLMPPCVSTFLCGDWLRHQLSLGCPAQ